MSSGAQQLEVPSGRKLLAGFALACLAAALLRLTPVPDMVELNWLDVQFRLLRQHAPIPAADDIAIVGLDDATLREFNVPLTAMHVELGRFLEALAEARPRAVGLDVTLPPTSYDGLKPGLDAALARGMLRLRTVAPLVLGITVDSNGRARPIHKTFAALAGAEGIGYVLVPLDRDGIVRRFDERLGDKGEAVPTLAGQLARKLGVQPGPGLIQYALGERYAYIPLQQVLKWQAAGEKQKLADAFAGKVVLLGSIFPFDDRHRLPVRLDAWDDDDPTSHGVLIHAQQLRSLLEGRLVQPLSGPLSWLLVLAAALAWWARPRPRDGALLAVLLLALFAAGLYLLREGTHLPAASIALVALLSAGARAAFESWSAMRDKRRLRAAFAGFVSPPVLSENLSGRLQPRLGGERREICLLFSDIRGFTTLSESLPPEEVTRLLDRYFGRMVQAIHAHGGTLDKFMGDGIMSFFGAPQASAAPCDDAFAAARDMLGELAALNAELAAEGKPELRIGIGLNFGAAVVGYIGAADRHEYTAIGDAVNIASRIEGLTKEAGYPLLTSRVVYDRLARREQLVPLGEMAVKGRAAVEVFGWRPD
jgi:class 3 adenylate cyclase/CHASE2 domain-containing sensor protein